MELWVSRERSKESDSIMCRLGHQTLVPFTNWSIHGIPGILKIVNELPFSCNCLISHFTSYYYHTSHSEIILFVAHIHDNDCYAENRDFFVLTISAVLGGGLV